MTRLAISLAAAVALVAAPLVVSPSHADEPGYVGVVQDDGQDWPDKHLAAMTTGKEYSDALEAPFDWDSRDEGTPFRSSGLPAGIVIGLEGTRVVTLTGVPTSAAPLAFTIHWYGTEGAVATLQFTGEIESGKSPTTTALVAPDAAQYDSIPLRAEVLGNPATSDPVTGTVEFYASGSALIGSGELVDGVATATGSIDKTNAGGLLGITAKYLGDENYDISTSASKNVRIYVPTASGIILENEHSAEGVVVDLVGADDPTTVIDTVTTAEDGEFELSPGAIESRADAELLYYIRVTYPDESVAYFYEYGAADVTDIDQATSVGPSKHWKSRLTIRHNVAPVWTDTSLLTPRQGSEYTDFVAASSSNPVYYSVSEGSLPEGLSLNDETGEVSGEPQCRIYDRAPDPCYYAFTITASNGHGDVTHDFEGTLLPAGVPPTWSETALASLQMSTPVNDGVTAVGDPTITYDVSDGELPRGLELSAGTGAITGTPTVAGDFWFTIEATNEFGSITTDFEGTVAAAPEIDLALDFEAGTKLSDASTTISAGGLKVGSDYTLTMHSRPVVLYTGVIDSTGGFTWNVALPADTPAGAHRLVLSGIAPDGSTMTAEAWFTLLADGTIGAISYTGSLPYGGLPFTGLDATVPIGLGTALLALGGLVLLVTRRRQHS